MYCTSSLPPFPNNEYTLSLFVAYLYREGLCYTTVKTYLSGVHYMHIKLGLGDMLAQHMPQLEYITKGLRKLTSKGSASKRLPITPHLMHILRSAWESLPNRFDAEMLWAASCMCLFGFLRSGEIVVPSSSHYDPNLHLSYGDVCLNNTTSPKFLAMHIKASKTDPFRQGISIYLGKSGVDVCPVSAILAYMVSRGNQPGPFFVYTCGQPLIRERFVS